MVELVFEQLCVYVCETERVNCMRTSVPMDDVNKP